MYLHLFLGIIFKRQASAEISDEFDRSAKVELAALLTLCSLPLELVQRVRASTRTHCDPYVSIIRNERELYLGT